MAVYKTKLSGNYTQIPNDLIRNTELPANAKIVLITMLSLSAECETTKGTVKAMCGLGYDAATNALNALEKAGYCRKRDDRKKGRFSCEYDFYNVPTFGSVKNDPVSETVTDTPSAVQPSREIPPRSTLYKKKEALKKEAVKTEAEKATPALPHGKHENVFLTDNEYRTLVETYGKEQTDYSIDTLSDFKKKKPNFKSIRDFNKLMTSWIKQDIGWGKTPKTYVPYQASAPQPDPETSKKQDELSAIMAAMLAGDYDSLEKGLKEAGF